MHSFSIHKVKNVIKERRIFDNFTILNLIIVMEDDSTIDMKLFTDGEGQVQIEDGPVYDCTYKKEDGAE